MLQLTQISYVEILFDQTESKILMLKINIIKKTKIAYHSITNFSDKNTQNCDKTKHKNISPQILLNWMHISITLVNLTSL